MVRDGNELRHLPPRLPGRLELHHQPATANSTRLFLNGPLAPSDWIVEDVQTDAHGIRHARLVSVADPTVRKTLAAEVLIDPAWFEQV
jgi:hypothetical protein